MKLLLDTNALYWLATDSRRLSKAALAAHRDPSNEVAVSVASAWELQIKQASGKLNLEGPAGEVVYRYAVAHRVKILNIELPHISALSRLPMAHRDPFDRIIVATALAENFTIVSPDAFFREYPAPVLW